ncbi:MAG: lysylphosphatidylglycerol synthase transmembrane domain-containing protein [Solirubrobacteraceae bacterium]
MSEADRTARRLARFGRTQIGGVPQPSDDEDMPRVHMTRDRAIFFGLFVASAIALLYFVLPHLAGLRKTWDQVDRGNPAWIVGAGALELLSFGGYVMLFRTVFLRDSRPGRIDWATSYEITMAGLAATRLFAAAGSGGVALTAWALRRSGMERRAVASRMVAFMTILYGVYMLVLVVVGIGLRTGLLPGGGSFAITVLPATFGASAIALMLGMSLLPADVERRLESWSRRGGRGAKILARLATVPALAASGVRGALAIVRERDVRVLGALAWWGFDVAVLWASFHAFGAAPPFFVITMAYFVGMLANVLPLPGGIGGVDGGMIGALIAFGVDGGLAVVAVLVYRGFSFWLPTIPGAIAYFQLRRRVRGWTAEASPPARSAVIL